MRTRAIQPGDVVLVDVRGRVFYARVLGAERAGVLAIAPLERRVSDRSARVRDVVDHWSQTRPDDDERAPVAQLQLDGVL